MFPRLNMRLVVFIGLIQTHLAGLENSHNAKRETAEESDEDG